MNAPRITRRRLIGSLSAATGGLALGGCQKLLETAPVQEVAYGLDSFTRDAQRLVSDRTALAREYAPSQMSPRFRTNGSTSPETRDYRAHLANGFADWRLRIGGLVERPLALSLDDLKRLPARSQITRHDCVEGWSAIGQWTGTPLKLLLDMARLDRARARYILFRCADMWGDVPYYESVDLIEAFHPQTIMAWGMNGAPLPQEHGAPVRLRAERQLGYKHAKFVMEIAAIADLADHYGGKGGLWEDRAGYAWWAGI